MSANDDNRSEEQAAAQFKGIAALMESLHRAEGIGDEDERNSIMEKIEQDPLCVQVRYDWITPGATEDMIKDGPDEFLILLCTGGPAVRIRGELGAMREPDTATIEHQDWFTPWKPWPMTAEQEQIVLDYCRCFYFGE